jgi:nitrogen fixation protein FixH
MGKETKMREITGRKVFVFTASAFGLIMAVNFTMAYQALSTFPGLEVKSSYVASQSFDADRAAQQALGWQAAPQYDAAAQTLRIAITDAAGAPAQLRDMQVLVGRSTIARDDFIPVMQFENGAYWGDAQLDQGKWVVHLSGHAPDGTLFRQRLDLWVRP